MCDIIISHIYKQLSFPTDGSQNTAIVHPCLVAIHVRVGTRNKTCHPAHFRCSASHLENERARPERLDWLLIGRPASQPQRTRNQPGPVWPPFGHLSTSDHSWWPHWSLAFRKERERSLWLVPVLGCPAEWAGQKQPPRTRDSLHSFQVSLLSLSLSHFVPLFGHDDERLLCCSQQSLVDHDNRVVDATTPAKATPSRF